MTTSITGKILEWTEDKMDNIHESKHPYLKAFGLGMIEGAIDGAVLAYPFLIAGLFIAGKKLKNLEK